MKKGVATILILFLTALVIVGYFAYKNYWLIPPAVSDSTANWKTYTNNKFGFSLKYPPTFKERIQDTFDFIAEDNQYTLEIKASSNSLTYDKIIKSIKENSIAKAESVKIINIANQEVYLESQMSAEGIFGRSVYIPLNKGVIFLGLSADTKLPGNAEPEIYQMVEKLTNQILSTFKFTN